MKHKIFNKIIMELKVGMTFTGSEQCFTGRVEVLEIDEPNNRLRVWLTKKNETSTSNWKEDWNLQHTIWGFDRGDYFVKNFTDYPQDLQQSTEQQCNIADVSKCYNDQTAKEELKELMHWYDDKFDEIVKKIREEKEEQQYDGYMEGRLKEL